MPLTDRSFTGTFLTNSVSKLAGGLHLARVPAVNNQGQGAVPVETSLHRQLKELYATNQAQSQPQMEARLGSYRIDVLTDDHLIEIQHGSLAAIRDKIAALLADGHRVLVVKPIVARKSIIRLERKGGRVLGRRASPKRGTILDLFHELVYFTRVFPHRNLTLEVPLVEIDELRYPGHNRRRRRRKNDHLVEDQQLRRIAASHRFQKGADLVRLLPQELPSPFHTADLAQSLDIPRWIAQRIAYCLRQMRIAQQVGKQGNACLYQLRSVKGKAA